MCRSVESTHALQQAATAPRINQDLRQSNVGDNVPSMDHGKLSESIKLFRSNVIKSINRHKIAKITLLVVFSTLLKSNFAFSEDNTKIFLQNKTPDITDRYEVAFQRVPISKAHVIFFDGLMDFLKHPEWVADFKFPKKMGIVYDGPAPELDENHMVSGVVALSSKYVFLKNGKYGTSVAEWDKSKRVVSMSAELRSDEICISPIDVRDNIGTGDIILAPDQGNYRENWGEVIPAGYRYGEFYRLGYPNHLGAPIALEYSYSGCLIAFRIQKIVD